MINGGFRGGWRRAIAGLVLALAPAASLAALPADRHHAAGKVRARVREKLGTTRRSALVDVLVRFRQTPGVSERALLHSVGGRLRRQLRGSSRWMAVRLPPAAVERLAESGAVEFVASDEPVSAALDVARQAANEPLAPAPESLLKGAGVTIAMLDSGVAPHADLQTLVASVDFAGNRRNATAVLDLPDDTTRAESSSIDPNFASGDQPWR